MCDHRISCTYERVQSLLTCSSVVGKRLGHPPPSPRIIISEVTQVFYKRVPEFGLL